MMVTNSVIAGASAEQAGEGRRRFRPRTPFMLLSYAGLSHFVIPREPDFHDEP